MSPATASGANIRHLIQEQIDHDPHGKRYGFRGWAMRCIQCKCTTGAFNNREHVMPQFLGTFEPVSMIIEDVCDTCNNENGKSFEELYRRDSIEGVLTTQYQFRNRGEIVIRGERLQTSACDDVFAGMHVFLNPTSGGPIPLEQVVVRLKSGSKHILLASHKDFEKNIKRVSTLNRVGVSIYANGDTRVEEIISKLRMNGINYESGVEKQFDEISETAVAEREYIQKYDSHLLRLPAKIAFFHFAYSVKKKLGNIEALFDVGFDEIRDFIITGRGDLVGVLPSDLVSTKGEIPKSSPTHMVVWRRDERGYIIGELTLFALMHYIVILGPTPSVGIPPEPGFGHLFDAEAKTIKELHVCIGERPPVPDNLSQDWTSEINVECE